MRSLLATLILTAGALAATTSSATADATPSAAYLEQLASGPGTTAGMLRQPLTDPSQVTVIGGAPVPVTGLDFNPTAQTLYALEAGSFGTLSTTDNSYAQIAALAPPSSQAWTSLSVDPWSGTTYAASRATGATPKSTITQLNPSTGASLGSHDLTAAPDLVATSVDCSGQMYGVGNSGNDTLYKINTTTWQVTVVGALGVDVGAQVGLDVDNATGALYLWPSDTTGPDGSFGTINTTTGAFTAIPADPASPGSPIGSFKAAIQSTCPQPSAQITSTPDLPTNDPTPTFGFATSTAQSVDCSFDQGTPVWHPCATSTTDSPAGRLADGQWRFRVRATFRGVIATDTKTFSVDTVPPDTGFAFPEQGHVYGGPLAQIHLTSDDPAATFRCSVDGGAFATCIADKVFPLPDGTHSLVARAVDAAGNLDPTPSAVSFRVDSTAPDTSIVAGPVYGQTIGTHGTSFTFTSTETGSSFRCSVDGRAYAACTSPYGVGLPDGPHTFQVAAVDAVGNTDLSPASRTYSIDTSRPNTSITSGPKQHSVVHRSKVTFAFTSSEPRSTFRCRLDGKRLSACSSPRTLRHLSRGKHTFTVAAVDVVGHRDATPAKRVFRVRK